MLKNRGFVLIGALWEFVEAIVFAAAIFTIVYLFFMQPNQVKGNSMYPTYHDGEYILTDKISYRLNKPERGDVIVFKSPKDQEVDFIKRIIGLPGETVKVTNGKVYVNNKQLSEPYLPASSVTRPGLFSREGTAITVTSDNYYVLGDNRDHSSDSREWGLVNTDEFIGRVFFRYFPFDRFGSP